MLRSAVLALALLASSPAIAADWAATLPPEAVRAHLDGQGLRILVVGAGDHAETADAAAVLAEALRGGAAVDLVMDSSAIGDVAGLDDAAIVAKAKNLPLDQVHVLRVFPAGGEEASVVVTLYDTAGEVLGGFNAATDKPLAAPGGVSGGLGAEAAAAVGSASSGGDLEAAMKEYELNYLWFEGITTVSAQSGAVMSRAIYPKKGKYREALTFPEFYEELGMPEKGAEIVERNKKATIGMLAGLAGASVMSVGWTPFLFLDNCDDPLWTENSADCRMLNQSAAIGGVLLMGGSTAMTIAGFRAYKQNRWTEDDSSEALRLADEHNQRLAEELGIPASAFEGRSYSDDRPAIQLLPGAWVAPGSAGVGLSGRF